MQGVFALLVALAALALCTSCAHEQPLLFDVRAINTDEEEVPCVVLLDDQLVLDAATNEPVRTPARVEIAFPEAPDGKRRSAKLAVRPAVPAAGEGGAGDAPGAAAPIYA
ncbi:MAG: hypothetical protein ACUVYA_08070, partial [Planctomycetota bacterium]